MTDLRWTEEQRELSRMLDGLLTKHSDSEAVRGAAASERGYDETLWSLLCDQVGIAALSIPEEYGGAGYGFAETAVVLEQLGRFLTPTPLLGTLVAVEALLRSGDADGCRRLLPGIADGSSTATLAWGGATACWPSDEPVTAPGGRLSGTVPVVVDADTAGVLLVVARTEDGLGLFEVATDASGVRIDHAAAMDLTLRLGSVSFDNAQAARIGGDASQALTDVHATAVAAVTLLQVGTAQRGLDMTVAYSKERVQFGRAIGSFQALKHRMADLLVLVETSRSTAMDAALAVATGSADLSRRTSVAKAWCSDALDKVAAETIQLHGGIAITWEHDAHLVLKRAHSLGRLYGPAHLHRRSLL